MTLKRKLSESLLLIALLFFVSFSTLTFPKGSADETVADIWSFIDVPFYYQENNYYCGPAALQMVFDFYGENISQFEIAEVARTAPYVTFTDDMRRAAHFSNMSTSMGNEMAENITGYTFRKLGYAASEVGGMTLDDLKAMITRGFPMILLMRWIPGEEYGHYRVAVGYNDTHVFLHDPWNTTWGYTEYGGPNTAMNYTFFQDMWDYSGRWGLFVSPWRVTINLPNRIHVGETFQVTADIFYPYVPFSVYKYPASSCKASLTLSDGLTMGYHENSTKNLENLQAGSSTQTSWIVDATQPGNYSITVQAEGLISGSVTEKPEAGPSYEYQDMIGGSASISGTVQTTYPILIKGIEPDHGPPETKARLFGSDATPNGTVEALFGGPVNQTIVIGNDSIPIIIIGQANISVGWTVADFYGSWEITFNVPTVPLGNYSVYAFDNETLTSDVTGFSVTTSQTQIIIWDFTPSSGQPNVTVYIDGQGATAYGEVRIRFDGLNVASSFASQDGYWSASFTVPNFSPGNHFITALDVTTDTADTRTFIVTPPPAIHVSPQGAPIGSEITVTGEGFTPNTGIYLTFEDMLFYTPIYTNEKGEFNATNFVPVVTSGDYTIKAVSAYFYPQGLQTLVQTSFEVTTGLDTLFQAIDDMKTALNQTQNLAQTTLDEALSAKEAVQAVEAIASQARTYALIAMTFTIITSALVSIYFAILCQHVEKPKHKEETA